MTVAVPSTPASYFHLLRRQAYARPRRPLVVATPKSLLRLKAATSPVEDFTQGSFRPVLPDEHLPADAPVDRVLLCAGKVYYDLLAHRARTGEARTAIVRLEQLHPFDADGLTAVLAPYGDAELVWVQEEPANQGGWTFVSQAIRERLDRPVRRVSRAAAASPATGSSKTHLAEQDALVAEAFAR